MLLRIVLIFATLSLLPYHASAYLEPGTYEWFCKGQTFNDEVWEMIVEFSIEEDMYDTNESPTQKVFTAHSESLVTIFSYNGEDVIVDSFTKTKELQLVDDGKIMTYEFYNLNTLGEKTARAYIVPLPGEKVYDDKFEFNLAFANGKFKRGLCKLVGPFKTL